MNSKELAKNPAGGSGNKGVEPGQCVITVPPYWSEEQRQTLGQAAKLAGLDVISLINDLTAGAL